MNQSLHTLSKEMLRTWYTPPSYLQRSWFELCSDEVRFIYGCSSVYDRTTTEEQPKNRGFNYEVGTK